MAAHYRMKENIFKIQIDAGTNFIAIYTQIVAIKISSEKRIISPII